MKYNYSYLKSKMVAVIFEVIPRTEYKQEYLEIAADLKSELIKMDGFISIERFVSLQDSNKILSLSFWRDEASVSRWRMMKEHRRAQKKGRTVIFEDYRLRVAGVIRDYGMHERDQAPIDGRRIHD
ncbi:MAG: antibiotic biosynthesis monooxygenase [Reichenbachiella sp.]|uniref:antibiotic biosynthesis monooxygenase family protein n=1 Tax=Reichenbachiella sp. TaxID=2184521 RepID=UPI0032655E00